MGKDKSSNKFKNYSSGKPNIIPWQEIDLSGYKLSEHPKIVTIEATCVTGFEPAALDEVKTKLKVEHAYEIMGRVVFDIESDRVNEVLEMRTFDNIFVVIGASVDLDLSGAEEETLNKLAEFTLDKVDWTKGLDAWNKVFAFYDGATDSEKIPNFRCTCYRTGENIHKFSSMDVAKHVGGKVQEKFGWGVKMKGFDIEVLVNIDVNNVYVCLALTKVSLFRRNISHFGPTTLRATICASLLQLANIQPGEIVCDPMCGGGSIPIEGGVAFKDGFFLAGDFNNLAIDRARDNLKTFDNSLPVDGVQWDATNIPLRDNCVDVLVSDLPFGKRSGSKADNRVLYPQTLISMARVVKPTTGRAVLLTQDKTSMFKSAGKFNKFWKINRQLYCNIGGLSALVFLMTRTELVP